MSNVNDYLNDEANEMSAEEVIWWGKYLIWMKKNKKHIDPWNYDDKNDSEIIPNITFVEAQEKNWGKTFKSITDTPKKVAERAKRINDHFKSSLNIWKENKVKNPLDVLKNIDAGLNDIMYGIFG